MGQGSQRTGRSWSTPLLCLLVALALSAGAAQYADEPEDPLNSFQQAPLPAATTAAAPIAAQQAAQQRLVSTAQAPDSVYTPMDRPTMQSNMRQAQQPVTRTQVLTPGQIRRNRNRAQLGGNINNAMLPTNQEPMSAQGTPGPLPAAATAVVAPEEVPVPAAVVPLPAMPASPPFTVDMDPRSAQLSPSVLLMGYFDWQIIPDANGKPWSRCLDMVWRARRLARGNKLNFVPTHHWIPGAEGFGIDHFCYMYKDESDAMKCAQWDQPKIDEFERSMTHCFAEAYRNGFTPYVRPHLDDGYVRGIWRNGLLFSPTVLYGSHTYKQIMLDPLAKALAAALRTVAADGMLWPMPNLDKPRVYFALQGEMSATMMRYTRDWVSTIPDLRALIGTTLADVKFGVGLNFNALDQTEYSVAPNQGLGWFGSRASAARYPVPSIDGDALNDLVTKEVDFIGISAYAPYSGPGILRTLGNGIDLAALINSGKLELHYSEFGIGGGNEGNAAPAVSARMVGKQPWAGVAGFFSPSTNPWQISSLQAYRTEFYPKPWNSTTAQGTYRDADMVRQIARHNIKVIAAQTLAAKGPELAQLEMQRLEDQEAALGSFYSQALQPYARMPASRVQQEVTAAPPPQQQQQLNPGPNSWLSFLGK
ncbi:hypothetical protein COO60DRAFT_1474808 [Scenedesmus sp. NREL 46B-D3]|nr:hypothetical protein COO60DRAFT_1474808 [Scenedesmus sp. NREL 46B-D3]